MPAEQLIPVRDFCTYHRLALDFVYALEQRGLIETILVEQTVYLYPNQLGQLEKLVRIHQELAVHIDDLDVIAHLLERQEDLQTQIRQLRNRLAFYEPTGK